MSQGTVGDVTSNLSYARHRIPPAIIRHAVWLYFRFALSYRDVEDLLAERASMRPMRPSCAGYSSSVAFTPTEFAGGDRDRRISGTYWSGVQRGRQCRHPGARNRRRHNGDRDSDLAEGCRDAIAEIVDVAQLLHPRQTRRGSSRYSIRTVRMSAVDMSCSVS